MVEGDVTANHCLVDLMPVAVGVDRIRRISSMPKHDDRVQGVSGPAMLSQTLQTACNPDPGEIRQPRSRRVLNDSLCWRRRPLSARETGGIYSRPCVHELADPARPDYSASRVHHDSVFTSGSNSSPLTRSGFPIWTPAMKSPSVSPAACEQAAHAMTTPPSSMKARNMS